MAKLVQKSGYIKSEKAGGYMKYIATREGVEKLTGNGPVTKGQRELVQKLLHDFPDAVELFEYEDYRKTPTLGTASAFITMALDANLHEINSESGYLSYIATRPRVERRGAHGLFSSATAVDLDAAMSELEAHDGNVWTIIYSLRREDAARLGYDNADAWRDLLMMHAQDLAKAMKIPADHFRWYAAFHNEGHHPHIHMMVWSDDPKEGFLTREGIAAMRSKLTNTIFHDEMIQIYERKDVAYKELIEAAQDTMRELIQKMEHQLCDNPVIEEQMRQLVQALETTTGKKQYGYRLRVQAGAGSSGAQPCQGQEPLPAPDGKTAAGSQGEVVCRCRPQQRRAGNGLRHVHRAVPLECLSGQRAGADPVLRQRH